VRGEAHEGGTTRGGLRGGDSRTPAKKPQRLPGARGIRVTEPPAARLTDNLSLASEPASSSANERRLALVVELLSVKECVPAAVQVLALELVQTLVKQRSQWPGRRYSENPARTDMLNHAQKRIKAVHGWLQ